MKRFRIPPQAREQIVLIPTSLEEAISQDEPVRIFHELVQLLDHEALLALYPGGGAPAYNPVMLMEVLLFAYNEGLRSSRQIARMLTYDLRFMYLAEGQRPDFRTISDFRRAHPEAIAGLLTSVVRYAMEVGLVVLEHVSVDGTKIEAVASRKSAYNEDRLARAIANAEERLQTILSEAEAVDAEEATQPETKLPEELATAKQRLSRLQEIKQRRQEAGVTGPYVATEPESGVIKTRGGKRPAYNVQAAVDTEAQIVLAVSVTNSAADNHIAPTVLDAVEAETGAKPAQVSMDGGYWSAETLADAANRGIDLYLPPQGGDHEAKGFTYEAATDSYKCAQGETLPFHRLREDKGRTYRVYRCSCKECPLAVSCHGKSKRYKEIWQRQWTPEEEAHRKKMQSKEARTIYKLRAMTVEPVFGQWKQCNMFNRFLLRGNLGALIESQLVAIAHNLRKCARGMQLKMANA